MKTISDLYVYSRIGMALLSAQRVEFITGELLTVLTVFDKQVYGITSTEFLDSTQKAKKARKTLGHIFKLLKLNSKFVIEEELNEYLRRRNILVHGFWKTYLTNKLADQGKVAVEFCNEFGKMSEKIESFFKGFLYFLSLRHVKDSSQLDLEIKKWEEDFEYFNETLGSNKNGT